VRPHIQTKQDLKEPSNLPSSKSLIAIDAEIKKPVVTENTTLENKDVECARNFDKDPERARLPPLKK
jgi:hypothetical protein